MTVVVKTMVDHHQKLLFWRWQPDCRPCFCFCFEPRAKKSKVSQKNVTDIFHFVSLFSSFFPLIFCARTRVSLLFLKTRLLYKSRVRVGRGGDEKSLSCVWAERIMWTRTIERQKSKVLPTDQQTDQLIHGRTDGRTDVAVLCRVANRRQDNIWTNSFPPPYFSLGNNI